MEEYETNPKSIFRFKSNLEEILWKFVLGPSSKKVVLEFTSNHFGDEFGAVCSGFTLMVTYRHEDVFFPSEDAK